MLLLGWREKKHEEGKRAHYMLLLLLLLLSLVIVSARRCLIVKQMNKLTNGGGISPPPLPSCDRANARIVLRSVHADSSRTTRGSCSRRSGFVVREKGAEVLHCEAFALSRVLSRSTLKSGGRIRV